MRKIREKRENWDEMQPTDGKSIAIISKTNKTTNVSDSKIIIR